MWKLLDVSHKTNTCRRSWSNALSGCVRFTHSSGNAKDTTVLKDGKETHNTAEEAKGESFDRLSDKSTSKRKDNRRSIYLFPKVHSTDHLKQDEVHTEGLFAGNKPLFLGDLSPGPKRPNNALEGIFGTLTKIKRATEDSKGQEINIQSILKDLQSEDPEVPAKDSDIAEKAVIPWDASISGMVYNDEPFKHVPRAVVSKLKPFKLFRIERKSTAGSKKVEEMVKIRVHNSKVNDELQIIDLNQESSKKVGKQDLNWAEAEARRKYDEATKVLTQFKFIRSDQHIFKTDVDKLHNMLAKELYKMTKLKIDCDFKDSKLPFYIYIDKSLSSRILFRRLLKQRIIFQIHPLLEAVISSLGNEEQAEKFQKRIQLKINSTVKNLIDYLPSVYFAGDLIDCICHPSSVPGFGRMHWLKPAKRHRSIWGRSTENDIVSNLSQTYQMTRSGMRYVKLPINLHSKSFQEAFTEWDYYT